MKLIVVSDIFGLPRGATCLSKQLLGLDGAVHYNLGEISGAPDLSGENLHRHLFQEGGMDRAVDFLCDSDFGPALGLGYSAGGTALWRAVAAGMTMDGIFCVSSTRLRDEGPIQIPTRVFFGDRDQKRPSMRWCLDVPDKATILPGAEHEYYLNLSSANSIETIRQVQAAIDWIAR